MMSPSSSNKASIPAVGEAAGVSTKVHQRFKARTATIEKLRKHEAELAKALNALSLHRPQLGARKTLESTALVAAGQEHFAVHEQPDREDRT